MIGNDGPRYPFEFLRLACLLPRKIAEVKRVSRWSYFFARWSLRSRPKLEAKKTGHFEYEQTWVYFPWHAASVSAHFLSRHDVGLVLDISPLW